MRACPVLATNGRTGQDSGDAELTIRVDRPRLEWTVWMREPSTLRLLNRVSQRLPLWTWRHSSLLKPREWMARGVGMGAITLAGPMPSGHVGVLMPQRIYLIDRAHARLEGANLGTPTRLRANPSRSVPRGARVRPEHATRPPLIADTTPARPPY
jgi:hypothetical protein